MTEKQPEKYNKHRLCIAFGTQKDMMRFFKRLQIAGHLPDEAGVRYADSLDGGGGTLDHMISDPEGNPGRYIELHTEGVVEV